MNKEKYNTGDTVVLLSNFFHPMSSKFQKGTKGFLKKIYDKKLDGVERYRYNDYDFENGFNIFSPKLKRRSTAYFFSSEFTTTRMVLIEKYIKI